MSQIERFAAVSALALTLAACGSSGDDADAPAAMEEAAVEDGVADAPVSTDGDVAGEDMAATDDAAVEAEPAAARSAPVVAVAEPDSFATCKVCHAIEPGQNGIGPSLAGVAGRPAGAVANFSYSPAMRGANLTWDDATLDAYLADPSGIVPGTTMAIPGLPEADRQAIIAYLKTL